MPKIVQLSLVWLVVAALYVLLVVQEGFAQPTGCGVAGSQPCAVPEPGSLSLLVAGVAATLYIFRGRRK
jgi:hypothetical protein